MRDTSASASSQLGAACSRCLLVDLELPGVLPITELDAVDGRRPLDRDPALEHVLENARRVAVKRVAVASTAARARDDLLARLELDCSRLGDLGPFALKVDLPRVRRRPRQTAADPPGRVQVALDGVGRSHWTTLRAEDDGRPETAPVASASSRI